MTATPPEIPDRLVVRRDPAALAWPALRVFGILLLLGAVGGIVWGVVVPGVTGVVVRPDVVEQLPADVGHRFDAIALYASVSAVVGVAGAIIVWSVHVLRGPLAAALVTTGGLVGSAIGVWTGGLVARLLHPGRSDAPVGRYVTSAPSLRLTGARLDLAGGLDASLVVGMSWAVVVVAPAAGLLVILVRMVLSDRPDLNVPDGT